MDAEIPPRFRLTVLDERGQQLDTRENVAFIVLSLVT
jgi:hypothetical protein